MKSSLVALLFCTHTIVSAQPNPLVTVQKPIMCGPIDLVMKGLADPSINESPVWLGRDVTAKSDYGVFVNQKTKAFTIVQFGKEIACIIGMGDKSMVVPVKPDL